MASSIPKCFVQLFGIHKKYVEVGNRQTERSSLGLQAVCNIAATVCKRLRVESVIPTEKLRPAIGGRRRNTSRESKGDGLSVDDATVMRTPYTADGPHLQHYGAPLCIGIVYHIMVAKARGGKRSERGAAEAELQGPRVP